MNEKHACCLGGNEHSCSCEGATLLTDMMKCTWLCIKTLKCLTKVSHTVYDLPIGSMYRKRIKVHQTHIGSNSRIDVSEWWLTNQYNRSYIRYEPVSCDCVGRNTLTCPCKNAFTVSRRLQHVLASTSSRHKTGTAYSRPTT